MTRLGRTSVWPGIALAGGVFVVCLLVSLAFGPASLSLGEVWHFVTTGPVQGDLPNAIFWQIRLPRVLVACLVGAELAVAGVVLQDLFLNPLTDPYVTGVSSGAALGATAGSGFPTFSTEVLFKNDPDVYIADSGSMSEAGDVSKRSGFAELTAVKDGHVYVIEDSIIARPGPRLAEGLQELVKMIHPEAAAAQ